KVTLKEGSKNPESGSLPVVVYNSSFLDLPTSLCNAHKNSRLTHIDTMPMPLVLQPTILALHAQTRALQQINIIHVFRGLAGQCFSSYSSAQIALRPMAANVGVGGWYITIVIAYCPWYLAKPQPQPTTAALYPAHTFAKILVASQLHWRSFWYSDNHHISCLRPMAARHALPRNITFPGRAIHQC
ncbi:unnamed protein product, partial [Fusarium graminearum]